MVCKQQVGTHWWIIKSVSCVVTSFLLFFFFFFNEIEQNRKKSEYITCSKGKFQVTFVSCVCACTVLEWEGNFLL